LRLPLIRPSGTPREVPAPDMTLLPFTGPRETQRRFPGGAQRADEGRRHQFKGSRPSSIGVADIFSRKREKRYAPYASAFASVFSKSSPVF